MTSPCCLRGAELKSRPPLPLNSSRRQAEAGLDFYVPSANVTFAEAATVFEDEQPTEFALSHHSFLDHEIAFESLMPFLFVPDPTVLSLAEAKKTAKERRRGGYALTATNPITLVRPRTTSNPSIVQFSDFRKSVSFT